MPLCIRAPVQLDRHDDIIGYLGQFGCQCPAFGEAEVFHIPLFLGCICGEVDVACGAVEA